MEKKIAVASDDGIHVTGHVGRCEMFIVFNTVDGKIQNVEKRVNNFTRHRSGHHHNHGHSPEHSGKHYGLLEGLKDCDTLICSAAAPSLINDLEENGINVILTDEMDSTRAVELFLDGNLKNDPSKSCGEHKH